MSIPTAPVDILIIRSYRMNLILRIIAKHKGPIHKVICCPWGIPSLSLKNSLDAPRLSHKTHSLVARETLVSVIVDVAPRTEQVVSWNPGKLRCRRRLDDGRAQRPIPAPIASPKREPRKMGGAVNEGPGCRHNRQECQNGPCPFHHRSVFQRPDVVIETFETGYHFSGSLPAIASST